VQIDGVLDADGEPVFSPVMVEATIHTGTELDKLTIKQRKVLDCLNLEIFREAGAPISDIAEATGINRTHLYHILSRLMKNELVSQEAPREPFLITGKGIELVSDVSNVAVVAVVADVNETNKITHTTQSVNTKTTATSRTSRTNSDNQARNGNDSAIEQNPTSRTNSKKKGMFSGELPGMEKRTKGVRD
jgi:DNA-binding IscR family transcriptional regulator